LLSRTYPHACCDEPLSTCLGHEQICPLVLRLAANICGRVSRGQDNGEINRALAARAHAMLQLEFGRGNPAAIDVKGLPAAGAAEAPITVVEYADGRGPHCARMTPGVYQAVVRGPLKGKVKLFFKPFPLRRNPHAKEAGLGIIAAAQLGRYWQFILHSFAHVDQFTVEGQPGWAEAVGLDRQAFIKRLADPATKKTLVASKMEGLENNVTSTPTFFIEGRKYGGELEIHELVDLLEELHDSLPAIR